MQKLMALFVLNFFLIGSPAFAESRCETYFDQLWTWAGNSLNQIQVQPKCKDFTEIYRKESPKIPKVCAKIKFAKMPPRFQAKWAVQLAPEGATPDEESTKPKSPLPEQNLSAVDETFQRRWNSRLNTTCREKMAGVMFHHPAGKVHQSASPDPR